MRIAQLAGWYSPTSGGIRTVVHRLGDGYRARGHGAVLVVPGARDVRGPERIELAAPVLPASGGYRVLLRRGALAPVLEDLAPDVVELHDKNWLPAVAAWATPRDVPVVLFTHERFDRTLPMLLPWVPAGATSAVARRLRCTVQQKADAVVAASDFAAAEYPGARRVPLGVDLEVFRGAPVPLRARGPVRLVLASRLSREKRPHLTLDTVAALRGRGVDVALTVLGGGPLAARMRRAAVGLPVEFAGFTRDRDVLAARLAAADVLLAPGPAETFGLAALEALACGTPVVAAAGAAVAELVATTPAAGRAAGPTGEEIATAVEEVLAVAAPVRRRAARALAERYPWSAAVDAVLTVHRDVVATRTPAARVTA